MPKRDPPHYSLDLGDATGQMAYWDNGGTGDNRQALLLLHGLFDHKGTWRQLYPRLERRFRLIAPDLLGSGLSAQPRLADAPAGYAYSPAMHCAHISALIEHLALDNLVLGGNSLGAGIALYLLYSQPHLCHRVRGLVLLDPAAYPQTLPGAIGPMGSWPGRLLSTRALARIALALGLERRAVTATYQRIFHDLNRIPPGQVEEAVALLQRRGVFYAYHLMARHIAPPDSADLVASYPGLDLPTLILWGSQDRILPPQMGRRLAADLPHAKLRLVENCGHAPQLEAPDTVAEEILTWVKQQW
jgi:pimeloyl-ACP methyl ester carboxylesterase